MPPNLKRKRRVPRPLHDELQDYASLLRALDTTDPLAVARSITQATSPKKRRTATATATEKPKRKRDTWTRWPLLVNDITLPQFGLDDEIAVLARNCLRDTIDPDEIDDDNNNLDPISTSATAFLSSTLALLAHHTPARTQSMQDRLNPIGWRDVLDIVAASGDVDATMVSNVKARLEAIYGPSASGSNTIDRLRLRSRPSRARAALEKAEDALFALVRPPDPDMHVEPRPFVDTDAYDYWDSQAASVDESRPNEGGSESEDDEEEESDDNHDHRPQTPSSSSESEGSRAPSPSPSASSTFSLRPLASTQAFSSESDNDHQSGPPVGGLEYAEWEDDDDHDDEEEEEEAIEAKPVRVSVSDEEEQEQVVEYDPNAYTYAQSDSDSSYEDG